MPTRYDEGPFRLSTVAKFSKEWRLSLVKNFEYLNRTVLALLGTKLSVPTLTSLSIVSNNVAVDASVSHAFTLTLTGNVTITAPTNGYDGQVIRIRLIQDATGGRTVTLGTGWVYGTDIPSLSLDTTANKVAYLTGIYRTTGAKWHVASVIGGF